MPVTDDDSYKYNDHPLITYSNRLQKHMLIVTTILDSPNTAHANKATPLRMLIANLPPSGKEALKIQWEKLVKFEHNTDAIPSAVEFETIYSEISDYIYDTILQDSFRAIPLNRKPGTMKESTTRVSDVPFGMGL